MLDDANGQDMKLARPCAPMAIAVMEIECGWLVISPTGGIGMGDGAGRGQNPGR